MPDSAPHPEGAVARIVREVPILMRASVSSVVATAVDGVAYQAVLFAEIGHYAIAAFVGAVLGAITNFTINRVWAFPPTSRSVRAQLPMYAAASGLVYLGLQGCLTLFVEFFGVNERLAWLPAKGIAWAGISYPLFRFVVFARRPDAKPAAPPRETG